MSPAASETLSPEIVPTPGSFSSDDERGVTPRVVFLCLGLAAFFGYIIPVIDFRLTNTFLGATHLPPGALGALLILLALNGLLKLKGRAGWGFSRNELLTVYISCLFSCLVPGRGSETFFIPNVIASFYYSTRENGWLKFLEPYLKPWMTPALDASGHYDPARIQGWYLGTGSIPWGAWLVPLLAWGTAILALYGMLCCLGVMLRAQWSEREALAFPLLRLPMELTAGGEGRETTSFFHNPLTWTGFGIAAFVQLCNGLNNYIPEIPKISLQISTSGMFSEAPWNQMGAFTFLVWPIVIGISYLLTSEISFSLWFFYVLTRAEMIIAYYLGYMPSTLPEAVFTRGYSKNFVFFQQIGAYLAYVALVLWFGRQHYSHIVKRALGRAPETAAERDEPLSYPAAFWGFAGCSGFLLIWTCAAGVRLDIALVLWTLYLMVAIGLTRVVAEGGLLFVQSGWAPLGPIANLMGGGPGAWLAPSSAVPAAFIGGALMSEMRGFLLPSFVQSFKLAHDRKIPLRPLLGLIAGCTVVSLVVSLWMIVHLGYDNGGLTLHKWWANGNGALGPIANAKEATRSFEGERAVNWFWLIIGALATWGMVVLRARLPWFPLHPIGYIMCAPFAMYALWFSIFLGWLAKGIVTRYGGTDAYRRLIPFFLGIVMGEIGMILFWLVVDGWMGTTGHQLMPN